MVANKLSLSLETIHVDNDRGQLDNALGLDDTELKLRTGGFASAPLPLFLFTH
jgi:hypothetical protein